MSAQGSFSQRLQLLLTNLRFAAFVWFGFAVLAVVLSLKHHSALNNYIIFRQAFYHSLAGKNLFLSYPAEYADVNLYGPLFAVVIAPFALLPDAIGSVLWNLFGAWLLYYAIIKLPVRREIKAGILIFNGIEIMNVVSWYQSNALIAGCLILGYVFVRANKYAPALFFILIGGFIKIYGFAGLVFFLFSEEKLKFIGWAVFWSAVFFFLPAILHSVGFLFQCYRDWWAALQLKSAKNTNFGADSVMQDISLHGMLRRIFNWQSLTETAVMLFGFCVYFSQLLRFNYFSDLRFQLYLLCSTLLFVVIFSSSSESPTYIIAFPAVCLWFLLQPPSKSLRAYFIFAFVFTSLTYSDLLTPAFRKYIARPYALKALPAVITWFIIAAQIYSRQFLKLPNPIATKNHATQTA